MPIKALIPDSSRSVDVRHVTVSSLTTEVRVTCVLDEPFESLKSRIQKILQVREDMVLLAEDGSKLEGGECVGDICDICRNNLRWVCCAVSRMNRQAQCQNG